MSFSGFIFETMIRRNKENRDLLTLRQEQMKDLKVKCTGKERFRIRILLLRSWKR